MRSRSVVGGAVAATDEAHAHALLDQVGQLALDRLAEDLHQELDLLGRPRPVLGRERVDGERLDAKVDRRLDRARGARAPARWPAARQAAALGPAAVAVHDDRDRARDLGQVRISGTAFEASAALRILVRRLMRVLIRRGKCEAFFAV